jgi:uncharacterized protein (DUF1800 family)
VFTYVNMRPRIFLATFFIAALLPSFSFAQDSSSVVNSRAINRILEQGTWGTTLTPPATLKEKGFNEWFAEQVNAPISTYPDQPMLTAAGKKNNNVRPVQVAFFENALNGPDQLRQRVAFALSEIWVVSETGGVKYAAAFPPLLNIFQKDAFGNYEQIMKDVTLNPAMGRFLNMVNNDKGNQAKGTSANENYAREIMQLFVLGLTQLNMDGSPVLDDSGRSVPTYSQTTVTTLAKAFTGWTYPPQPDAATRGHNPVYYIGSMVPVQTNHDKTQKELFPGFTLPAGGTAEQDLDQALHALFMQSSVPPFVSKLLIQHLTTSDPSPAYIERVASVFADNGSGVRGDMQSVIYAILTDPEARAGDDASVAPSPGYGHMREPILFVLNLLRGLNGAVSNTSTIASYAGQLGQTLFYAPSVFSFFSPGYRTPDGILAPEFQIYSTQSAADRTNLVNSAIYTGHFDKGTKFDLSPYIAAASNPDSLVALINTVFFHEDMSDSVKTAINQAAGAVTTPSDKAKAALYIALTSGEYQIIH